jgi:hypothetical protein
MRKHARCVQQSNRPIS